MKRVIILIVFAFLLSPVMLRAQTDSGLNREQLALRTELFNFLKEEGFMPEIDSDGDILFKSEGHPYFICVSKTDENPMYVTFFRQFTNPEEYSSETVVMATKALNLYKGIKVVCFEQSFRIGAELFVRDAEAVKGAFYKLKAIIDSAKDEFLSACKNVGTVSSSSSPSISEFPFLVTKLEVANVEKNGDIIQGYDASIWDFKTKYLQPRITIKPIKQSGTYTIYVKLYKDGILSKGTASPSGYSYSCPVTLTGNSSQVVTLSGYGSDTAGNWSIGEYRFEIWYNDYCIGSKTFKVI